MCGVVMGSNVESPTPPLVQDQSTALVVSDRGDMFQGLRDLLDTTEASLRLKAEVRGARALSKEFVALVRVRNAPHTQHTTH